MHYRNTVLSVSDEAALDRLIGTVCCLFSREFDAFLAPETTGQVHKREYCSQLVSLLSTINGLSNFSMYCIM